MSRAGRLQAWAQDGGFSVGCWLPSRPPSRHRHEIGNTRPECLQRIRAARRNADSVTTRPSGGAATSERLSDTPSPRVREERVHLGTLPMRAGRTTTPRTSDLSAVPNTHTSTQWQDGPQRDGRKSASESSSCANTGSPSNRSRTPPGTPRATVRRWVAAAASSGVAYRSTPCRCVDLRGGLRRRTVTLPQ
jgi:hypothetical protein